MCQVRPLAGCNLPGCSHVLVRYCLSNLFTTVMSSFLDMPPWQDSVDITLLAGPYPPIASVSVAVHYAPAPQQPVHLSHWLLLSSPIITGSS